MIFINHMIVMKVYFFASSRAIYFSKSNCGGWVFDGNLNYAIPLSEDSLNWCASHSREGIVFDSCFEPIQIGLKLNNSDNKKKKKK